MRQLTDGCSRVLVFDSPAEAIAACNPANFRPDEVKMGRSLPSWAKVVDAVDQPWKEGLDAVQSFIDKLEGSPLPEIKSIVRRIRYNEDDGDEIDLDRLRAGQSYWRASRREISNGPTEVTIVTDLSASKDISPVDILWRGAAAIAMAHLLECQGFSVALWAVRSSCPYDDNQYDKLTIAIPLKGFGDRLDLSTLVNCVSGWFYRSVLFTLTRTIVAQQGRKVAAGLGTPEPFYGSELDLFCDPTNRLYSRGSFSYYGALSATEWGLEQIKNEQSPPEPIELLEPDPIPPVPQLDKPLAATTKKIKPMKFKKVKIPKRRTED